MLTDTDTVAAASEKSDGRTAVRSRQDVWGVPFDAVTQAETLRCIERMIHSGLPGYVITANLQYVMLSDSRSSLREINRDAELLIADGMPIVWRSWFCETRLPERVAGSDLIYSLAELADKNEFRVFFLGGAPGVAREAAGRLVQQYPRMQVAGVECPPFRELSAQEERTLADRIRASRAHMLLVALGQPRGEEWIHRWYKQLNVPVCMQLGGSFNFVTGRVSRCPGWLAGMGAEWIWRLACEPRRLAGRYAANLRFLLKAVARDAIQLLKGSTDRQ